MRVCEYHEYTEGGEVCDPTHRDGGARPHHMGLYSNKMALMTSDYGKMRPLSTKWP